MESLARGARIGSVASSSSESSSVGVFLRGEDCVAGLGWRPRERPLGLRAQSSVSTSPADEKKKPASLGPHTGRDPTVKKPAWLRQRAPQGEKLAKLKESITTLKLNTVCEEAQCPNIGEVRVCRMCLHVVASQLEGNAAGCRIWGHSL